ncbi:hypothetical protein G6F22_017691 [Rhizopus arrhizus]|nr:hypothetical protein G6F22_017691 [Rhizopus arrhizus]KAG1245164.1 hypothetical protein G6F68_015172 [Rhizopus microsporus]
MMAEVRYMADDIDAVLGGASGHVVVGTLIAASAKLLPEAIARLMTEHPGIQVTVREGPSAQLLPALATGDVDIVTTTSCTANRYAWWWAPSIRWPTRNRCRCPT